MNRSAMATGTELGVKRDSTELGVSSSFEPNFVR